MLRQLARLTRPLPRAGEGALAIAVYADELNALVAARDTGYEGVACVDDAARAVVLLDDLHRRTGLSLFDQWSRGLLRFVLSMQRGDGTFVNFIRDWDGTLNGVGLTSRAGGLFWHARALRAVGRGAARGIAGAADAYALARSAIGTRDIPADVRVIHLLDALEHPDEQREDIARWAEEIAAQREGRLLRDNPDQHEPHLWGHMQEGVLARASRVLDRADLLALATDSAEIVFVPAVASLFEAPMMQPYSVACAIFVMDTLAEITGSERYLALAARARSWFEMEDRTGRRVYDRVRGQVADGVDHGLVNPRSGAESNIVAAQALVDSVAKDVESTEGLLSAVRELLEEHAHLRVTRGGGGRTGTPGPRA